ncbi:MAG: transporter substrate-binding domain-containing protein [Alphaproteobacteria bacterium]|nr:transporter substrate-binding domain-containing protein [Alphaproteobacteria bacterium]MBT5161391.1 transporter substrate-binding domain-containing protein [Alphaproteobacteria bacterium]MBT5918596.1 transporter substrate-binding domain-containing protein [Alphaproteobacteria bacterium]
MDKTLVNTMINGYFVALVALVFTLIQPVPVAAEELPLRFGIPTEEYPPYLVKGDDGTLGIVGDAFSEIAKMSGIRITEVNLPRKRLRKMMAKGKLDAIFSAIEWEDDVSRYVWTNGIILVSDNIVMRADSNLRVRQTADLKGKSIVVRADYKYPSLDPLITNGEVTSHKANKFENLLRMVERKHVDLGIIDQNVAKWIIRKEGLKFSAPLRFVSPGFDEVQYRVILLSKKWLPQVDAFNEALAKLKHSERWQEILNQYR